MTNKEKAGRIINRYKDEYKALKKDIEKYKDGLNNMNVFCDRMENTISSKKTHRKQNLFWMGAGLLVLIPNIAIANAVGIVCGGLLLGVHAGLAIYNTVKISKAEKFLPTIYASKKDIEQYIEFLESRQLYVEKTIDKLTNVINDKDTISTKEVDELKAVIYAMEDARPFDEEISRQNPSHQLMQSITDEMMSNK